MPHGDLAAVAVQQHVADADLLYRGFRMFLRWPGLVIQPATTSAASSWPAAMFSATARHS